MANVTPSGGLNLRVKSKPGKTIKVLRKGSEVDILEEHTWLKVKTKSGDIGYVSADFIDRNQLSPSATNIKSLPISPSTPSDSRDYCIIEQYNNSQFIGKTLYVDTDFFAALDRVNQFAKKSKVKIFITSSAREPGRSVSGAIVKPASRSNHLIGHAIDMNLQSKSGFYNSKKLKKSQFSKLPKEIKQFINLIREDSELRWGGDFRKEDPVHIDDNLNNANPKRWDSKFKSRK